MTPFSEIYDLFLSQIKDYNLDKLYDVSIDDFETVLQGYLMNAIPEFNNCTKNLENFNLTNKEFNETLTLTEKIILVQWMVIKWLSKEINNITQLNNFLSDTDFKMYSNANNLKEKSEYCNRLREVVNQSMVNYDLINISWSDWLNGTFI